MSVANYSGILDALKGVVTDDPGLTFRYKPANLWFNMELGILPTSALQNAFTIRFSEQAEGLYESSNFAEIRAEVEFGLNPLNDIYLNKIGECTKAVRLMENATHNDIDKVDAQTDYTTTYGDDIVVVTFDNINIQIRNTN